MNGYIQYFSEERPSLEKGHKYFIIKVKGDDGERYDILPSSDCETYGSWLKIIDEYGLGAEMEGLKFLMKRNGRLFFNKKVLPTKVEKYIKE